MKLKTRVFELYKGKYESLYELAQAMRISRAQIYRVKQGKRGINEMFIIGAIKAFPEYKLVDLFYVVPEESQGVVMKLKTRVFELYKRKYKSLYELARVMGISKGYIYNVRQGKQSITQKFIIGATKAFPGYRLDDLFYVAPE